MDFNARLLKFSIQCSVLHMKNECYRRYGSVFCSKNDVGMAIIFPLVFVPFKIATTTTTKAFASDADMYVC